MAMIPTAQSMRLAMLHRYNKAYETIANTTMNQKFAILANATIDTAQRHKQNLVLIGNGGHHYSTSPGPITDYHISTNTGLYNHIPIVLRKTDNDLTDAQRAKYALRKVIQVGSSWYAAYYAKRVDLTQFNIEYLIKEINATTGALVNTTTYVPTSSNLNPTPPTLSGSTPSTNKYVGAYLTLTSFIFDALDIAEIQNAATVLYGSITNAVVSELAFAASMDQTITITNYDDSTSSFIEAVHTLITDVSDAHFYNFSTGTMSVNSAISFGCATNIRESTVG